MLGRPRPLSPPPLPPLRLFGLSYLRGGSRSRILPYLIAAIDQLPRLWFGRTRAAVPPDLSNGWITVSKPDHLGDVLMATPFLRELRRQRPRLKVQLLVGSWSLPLARLLEREGLCHETVVLDTAVLNRAGSPLSRLRRHVATQREALAQIRRRQPRAFVDLRTHTSNALLLARRAEIPFRLGFGMRGFSYTVHRPIPFSPSQSTGQLLLDALPLLGLEGASYSGPAALQLPLRFDGELNRILTEIGTRPYVIVHAASPVRAREVHPAVWRALLTAIGEDFTLVAVGTPEDRGRYAPIRAQLSGARWVDLAGRTSLEQLVEVVRGSEGGVVIDSLLAHLLLAFGKPTALLMAPRASYRNSYPVDCPSIRFVDATASEIELGREAALLLDALCAAHSRSSLSVEELHQRVAQRPLHGLG